MILNNNKKLITIKIFILAGEANIMPPIGPLLTQYGVNAIKFCNEFNEKTYMFCDFFENISINDYKEEKFLLIVEVDIFLDKNYIMRIKKPTISYLLRLFTKNYINKHNKYVSKIDLKLLILLSKFKFPNIPLYSASCMLLGTARAMNIEIHNNIL